MRVAELSRRSGVSVPSIKYYLREGLLPPGERTGPNQASYDDHHVRRLRLIRALTDVGGLSVAAVRDVLGTVDADEVDLHNTLGVTQRAVMPPSGLVEDDAHEHAAALVDDLVARRGWRVARKNPGWQAALDVLATWERLDGSGVCSGSEHSDVGTRSVGSLDVYADAAERIARHEVGAAIDGAGESAGGNGGGAGSAEGGGRDQVVENAVLGIVLGGALLAALRGMAQEDASARRLR